MFIVILYPYQNSATFQHAECGVWGHLSDTAGPELWTKYILSNITVLGKWSLVPIANMQIIWNKIDSESV